MNQASGGPHGHPGPPRATVGGSVSPRQLRDPDLGPALDSSDSGLAGYGAQGAGLHGTDGSDRDQIQPTCTFNQANWQFDGTQYNWIGPTKSTGDDFNEGDSFQMQLQGRTFITPYLAFTLADQLDQYVKKHSLCAGSQPRVLLLKDLDQYIDKSDRGEPGHPLATPQRDDGPDDPALLFPDGNSLGQRD